MEDCLILANSADPGEMPHTRHFIWVFNLCESTPSEVSSIQRIKGGYNLYISDKNSTVKPVLSGHSKIDKTKVLKINGSLMKVESIAECSL